jgi:hypothetical protein
VTGKKNTKNRSYKATNFFRFEAKWIQEEGCEEIVKEAWDNSGAAMEGNLMNGLNKIAVKLKEWDSNVLGDIHKRIKEMKKELEQVRRSEINQHNVTREHLVKEKLRKLEDQHETFWKQRAHVRWLQKGDRNTSYFHAFASERKRRNNIDKLQR